MLEGEYVVRDTGWAFEVGVVVRATSAGRPVASEIAFRSFDPDVGVTSGRLREVRLREVMAAVLAVASTSVPAGERRAEVEDELAATVAELAEVTGARRRRLAQRVGELRQALAGEPDPGQVEELLRRRLVPAKSRSGPRRDSPPPGAIAAAVAAYDAADRGEKETAAVQAVRTWWEDNGYPLADLPRRRSGAVKQWVMREKKRRQKQRRSGC